MKRTWIIILAIIVIAAIAWWLFKGDGTDVIQRRAFIPTQQLTETGIQEITEDTAIEDVQIVAKNLEIPWGIAFLPNSELLITERPGRVVKIGADKTVIPVRGVQHIGEGGLLGIALHPNFKSNQYVYLYLTTLTAEGLINRVERYELVDDNLINKSIIIDNIPGARFHDGGQIKFGPDDLLYITVGDARFKDAAQDSTALNGSILRINDGGGIPTDNPFGTAVYSFGHRNPQGLTWDNQGRLWATEHGNSGGLDELNLIEPGRNYGWPVIEGDETNADMVRPVVHSGKEETWAPAGAAWTNGSIFFGGLRGESLYQAQLDGREVVSLKAHFSKQFGRIRAVELGPDGFLYISTSNRDGRGDVQTGDDKVIKIDPTIFAIE